METLPPTVEPNEDNDLKFRTTVVLMDGKPNKNKRIYNVDTVSTAIQEHTTEDKKLEYFTE